MILQFEGNIIFEPDENLSHGGCRINSTNPASSLSNSTNLLSIPEENLCTALTIRLSQTQTQTSKGGTVVKKALSVGEAVNARDALAKGIYTRLFDFIVKVINETIPFEQSVNYVGILDIAGFGKFITF